MQSDVILDAKDAGVLAGLEQREGVHLRGLAHVRPVDPENPVPNFQRAIPAWKERERREKAIRPSLRTNARSPNRGLTTVSNTKDRQIDRQTDRRTNGRTDGWTDL